MALKTTNKNRKKISLTEAKVELHEHNIHESISHTKPASKCHYKLFFCCLAVFALVAFFVI